MMEFSKKIVRECTLTEQEARAIAELIDRVLFDEIRNDTDIDSMLWLKSVVHGYEKMCECSGYVALTDGVVSGVRDV